MSGQLKYSKSKIDQAGETLKKWGLKNKVSGMAIDVLSNWRSYHISTLEIFAKVLRLRSKKISKNKNPIVAQRLKRTPSILLKLKNHKTMRLSTMQDIGGLRVIFETVQEVNDLVNLYRTSKSRHKLFTINDYISTPKPDGYKSIHLIYQLNRSPKVFIEIQARSQLQHIWATAVEVFGTLKNSSFKTGYGDKKWLELFSYLSSFFSIKEKTPLLKEHQHLNKIQISEKLQKLIRDLKAIEQLNIYSDIYRITSDTSKEEGRTGNYSLILLNSHDNTISIQSFGADQIEVATDAYIELEKNFYDDTSVNIVLVNTSDIKKLQISYPNYFMDTKILVRYLSQIMLDKFL